MKMKLMSVLEKHIVVFGNKISLFFVRNKKRWKGFAKRERGLVPQGFLCLKPGKSGMDRVFDRMSGEVNRLLTYPGWLPLERSQISFYSQRLSSFSDAFQNYKNQDQDYLSELLNDRTLDTLVSRILQYKNVRINFNDPPDLTSVGDRLAFEVTRISEAYKQVSGKAEEECDPQHISSQFYFDKNNFIECRELSEQVSTHCSGSKEELFFQDFPSQFYFDKNKFQEGEVLVGFQEEASSLLQQLASITRKKLEVISIVGMAGLGKTNLARRLYNDPYVVSYFYVRSWVTCHQVYQKRDLLLAILRSVVEITDEICIMDYRGLSHLLYRALMGRRYLIVIDDIWSNKVWDDLRRCFPHDKNGSKILLTTQLNDVAMHAQPDGKPLFLRFLTEEESFDLFKKKAFKYGDYIGNLSLIGKKITRKCCGLPLAIVVMAGLLKNNMEIDWWEQVAESVSSYIVSDKNQYMDTLAMSYTHLPQHLRPCFLSFGAFPEDHDIPVRKLMWLWIAEGFIHHDGTNKNLEDVAEDYLMDLVRRSLVVVGRKRSNAALKTCRIHSLLHDLCLRKHEEENLSLNMYDYNKHSFSCPHSLKNSSSRSQLFLRTNVPNIPSNCSCYSSAVSRRFFGDVSIRWATSQVITALDISSTELLAFPSEILLLINLRYLELRFWSGNPPDSISQLKELQTLIMSSRMNMIVPKNMWKMINLRHLCIKSGENFVEFFYVEDEPRLLENLRTLSLLSPTRPCQRILARTRNLQKLGLCGPLTTKSGDLKCPDLDHLINLETLKLLNTIPLCKTSRLSTSIIFPGNLKNLTVSNTYLEWKEAWIFEMIPNLEVLKLKLHAFVGKEWETSPETFPRLKLLKLDELDIVTMTSSRFHFPVLQRFQVYRCPYLTEIPEDIGNICTLESIELSGCSDAATNSAMDIQKEQVNSGNNSLKIILNPGLTKPSHNGAGRSGY